MTARLSKKAKVFNLLSKGNNVAWTTIRSRFDLTSPRAMIDTLRSEGNVIYENKSENIQQKSCCTRRGFPMSYVGGYTKGHFMPQTQRTQEHWRENTI